MGGISLKRARYSRKQLVVNLKSNLGVKPLVNSLKVHIRLYFKDKRKRDIDNYNKAILDSMTKIIYEDDSQIEELNVKKLVGCGFDKVEIEVEGIK